MTTSIKCLVVERMFAPRSFEEIRHHGTATARDSMPASHRINKGGEEGIPGLNIASRVGIRILKERILVSRNHQVQSQIFHFFSRIVETTLSIRENLAQGPGREAPRPGSRTRRGFSFLIRLQ